MSRIYITVTDELFELIKNYQQQHEISEARAAAELAAIGAENVFGKEVNATAPHGGLRIRRKDNLK